MGTEIDEIGGDVGLWLLKLMGLKGCRVVAPDVDEIVGDGLM